MMRRFIFNTLNVRKQYLYSIAAVLIVSMVSFALTEAVGGYRVVAFVLLLTVSILAITFDILPVLLAAALSAFIWDFFLYSSQVHASCAYGRRHDTVWHVLSYCPGTCFNYV